MDIENFSYNDIELGCVDVEVIRKEGSNIEKNITDVNVIFFRGEAEYFITLTDLKEDDLNYKTLKDKINNAIRKQISLKHI